MSNANFVADVSNAADLVCTVLSTREDLGLSALFVSQYQDLCMVQALEADGHPTAVLYKDLLQAFLGSEYDVSNNCNSDGIFLVSDCGYAPYSHLDAFKRMLDEYYNMHRIPKLQETRMVLFEFTRRIESSHDLEPHQLLGYLKDNGVPLLHQLLTLEHGYKEVEEVESANTALYNYLNKKGWRLEADIKLVKATEDGELIHVTPEFISYYSSIKMLREHKPSRSKKIEDCVLDEELGFTLQELKISQAYLWCMRFLENDKGYLSALGWDYFDNGTYAKHFGFCGVLVTKETIKITAANAPDITIIEMASSEMGSHDIILALMAEEINECLARL